MRITVFGGSERFLTFLKRMTEGEVCSFPTVGEALSHAEGEGGGLLFLLPCYDRGEMTLPEMSEEDATRLFSLLHAGTVTLYIENYPAYDYRDCYALGAQARAAAGSVGKYSICLSGRMAEELGFEILQKRGGVYFPNDCHTDRAVEILAEVKNCLGVHRVVQSEVGREGVALMKTGENVYCAMVDLTALPAGKIFSYRNWQAFYARLFGGLTGAGEEKARAAFADTYERCGLRYGSRTADRREGLERAVRGALAWHRRSGILLDEGRGGVYEMIRSFDLEIAKNVRGDSGMMTAALFMAAGRYFHDGECTEIAGRIAHNLLAVRDMQIREGENAGIFKWFLGVTGMGPQSAFVSDCCRVANALVALYRLTVQEGYRARLLAMAEALLAWFGGAPLLPVCFLNYAKQSVLSVQGQTAKCCPEFYDAPLILLKNAYAITGDERYREQLVKTATVLSERFPDYDTVTSHSDNFTYGRLLGALSAAQTLGDGPWTGVIDRLLQYFEERQHESGGFSDGTAYYDEKSIKRDMEFAVGLGEGNGNIADMVYCQNTLAYSLHILTGCRGSFNKERAACMRDRLVDFLLDTQILSSDPKTDGAWMRAFDMDGMEYYGCDKDFAWGPYCILTGWVTGIIPLVFLDLLGVPNMF